MGYSTKFCTVIDYAGNIAKYLQTIKLNFIWSYIVLGLSLSTYGLLAYIIRVIRVRFIRVKLGLGLGLN